jgi:hypothetical protein
MENLVKELEDKGIFQISSSYILYRNKNSKTSNNFY